MGSSAEYMMLQTLGCTIAVIWLGKYATPLLAPTSGSNLKHLSLKQTTRHLQLKAVLNSLLNSIDPSPLLAEEEANQSQPRPPGARAKI